MNEEKNLEKMVDERETYHRIASERLAKIDQYKAKMLYAGIKLMIPAGAVAAVALYYFLTK